MRNKIYKICLIYLPLFVLIGFSTNTYSHDDLSKEQLKNNLNSMSIIFSGSSVSRQVLHSNNDASIQYYRFSKSLHDDAVAAYKKGDLKEADRFVHASKKALLDAIEFANLQGSKKEKGKGDYESIRKSVIALMNALQRVSNEKHTTKQSNLIIEEVKVLLDKADKLYIEGQYKKGLGYLGDALNLIKPEIRNLRTGETLVKSLNFASEKDEYEYEIDRSDTHFMLLNMALKESSIESDSDKELLETVKLARKYRADAEKMASEKNYGEAIKKLEMSTSKIINEIRNAGVYIPN